MQAIHQHNSEGETEMRHHRFAAWALPGTTLCTGVLAAVLATGTAAFMLESKADPKILHIGSSGSLSSGTDPNKEKGAIESLEDFIKDETGMKNEALCKIICHNICCLIQESHELGINTAFWAETSLAQKAGVN